MVTITNVEGAYHFDEATGNAIDVHGTEDFTENGTVPSQTGQLDDARGAFATSNFFRNTTFFPINDTTDFSVSFWINRTGNITTDSRFLTLNGAANEYFGGLSFNANNKMRIVWLKNGGAISINVTDTNDMATGWHHGCYTYNGTTRAFNLYIDNSVVLNGTGASVGANTGDDWGMGNLPGGAVSLIQGYLDETVFFSEELSSSDVSDLWNSGNGLAYPFTEENIIDEDDTTTLSESLTINRNAKTFLIDEDDTTTLGDDLTISRTSRIFTITPTDTTNLSDTLSIIKVVDKVIDETDTATLSDTLTLIPVIQAEGIKVQIDINGVIQDDVKSSTVERSQNEFNTISSFSIKFDNVAGRHNDDFQINQEVNILADIDKNPETVIINGIIDDISFSGSGTKELLTISGREFGSILQDVIVNPRIFKDTEVSSIVNSLMSQNVSSITTNNVNVTTTTIDKITFTNISVFDALRQLAEISGFFFYVDTDKDLHFEQKNTTSSGVTLDNTNSNSARFKTSDSDQYTKVIVQGDRQLTGAESIQTTGTDNTGSVYVLDSKPYNTSVTLSGATNTILQPGGVININDPATENVKYLVDFQGQNVILTSGTIAGDNIQPNGSVVIFNYQRSTPVLSVKQIASNFPKHKIITDRNIKDINEASIKAQTFLDEHKDTKIDGKVDVKNLLDVTPGHTVLVNLPNQGQNNQTYAITNARYEFNPTNIQSKRILSLNLNKKTADFVDIIKEQILRLRAIESSETDSSITNLELGSSVVGVRNVNQVISTSIGSGFFFHVPNHNLFNSPSSLLGDMRTGSIVFENGVQI